MPIRQRCELLDSILDMAASSVTSNMVTEILSVKFLDFLLKVWIKRSLVIKIYSRLFIYRQASVGQGQNKQPYPDTEKSMGNVTNRHI